MSMEMKVREGGVFGALSNAVSSVSLEVHSIIEQTTDNYDFIKRECEVMRARSDEMIEIIEVSDGVLDPEDTISEMLLASENLLERVVQSATKQRGEFACKGASAAEPAICAIDEFIDASTRAHASIVETRWKLLEHDADYSPVSEKSYASADELIADLLGVE